MLKAEDLEASLNTDVFHDMVGSVLVSEAHRDQMRAIVNEYTRPIWKAHWAEHKQKYLDELDAKETNRDKKWFLEKLTDAALERDWKEHHSIASFALVDPAYYEKLDQAHKDNRNPPLREGCCPALEAEDAHRKCKDVLFKTALEALEEKLPELSPITDPDSDVWWMPCKHPKPDNYTGRLWSNQDMFVHSLIGSVASSADLKADKVLARILADD